MKLSEVRKQHGFTQERFAEYLGIPLRTYKRYEGCEDKIPKIKYEYIKAKIDELSIIDETHGVLTLQTIKEVCARVFQSKEVEYCYLFGSYAKGRATEKSDVDLFVSTPLTGLKFYGLVESLREALKKNVDVLNHNQIKDNYELTKEILATGIKIYG